MTYDYKIGKDYNVEAVDIALDICYNHMSKEEALETVHHDSGTLFFNNKEDCEAFIFILEHKTVQVLAALIL